MASRKKSLKANVEGNFFVDNSCINCDACRRFAPDNFLESEGYSYVSKQPENEQEILRTMISLLSCPTGSIGQDQGLDLKRALESLPLPITEEVFINGFNSKKSFGADSYFIRDPQGNMLIDSPRFTGQLVKKFEQMGGLRTILLTHRDDVADCLQYADYFKAEIFIHEAENLFRDDPRVTKFEGEFIRPRPNLEIFLTPGHTKGHCIFLYKKKYLFTGDHFAYLSEEKRFGSFEDACWFSWEKQKESVKLMGSFDGVEWLLPGHGAGKKIVPHEWRSIVDQAYLRMS